jgi:aminoglycoside phosphotransferase family enzyme
MDDHQIKKLANTSKLQGASENPEIKETHIFLYNDPVIFDCIEFNKDFRYIDVLNEIAFLCVDLDFYGQKDLATLFFEKYLEYSGVKKDDSTEKLFRYYKSYRANVRAKVTLISAEKKGSGNNEKELKDAKIYLNLMKEYSQQY